MTKDVSTDKLNEPLSVSDDRAQQAITASWEKLLCEERFEELLTVLQALKANGTVDRSVNHALVVAHGCLGHFDKACQVYAELDGQSGEMNEQEIASLTVWCVAYHTFYEQALVMSDWVLKQWPSDVSTWCCKSFALRNLHRKEGAIKCAWQALSIDPGDTEAWYALGKTYSTFGDLELAASAFRMVLDIDPEHIDALGDINSLRTM